MKIRTIAPFAGALLVSTGLLVAQTTSPQQPTPLMPQVPRIADVTAAGCLILGSGPTVFLLDNARLATEDPSKPGKTYMLASATDDSSFRDHLNQEVTVMGSTDGKIAPVPPPGEKVAEKDLPKFTARAVTMLAEKCMSPSR